MKKIVHTRTADPVSRSLCVLCAYVAITYFSLLESARRAGHNTFEYVKDVLTRLPDHPITRLDELLPDRWKPAG